jgi:hypothetical protein
VLAPGVLAGAIALSADPAPAQELRATVIARQQAEKASQLRAYKASRAEELVVRFKEGFLSGPSGFYPMYGSVYGGGGASFGAGYRRYYGDNTFWDVKGLYSIRNYKWIELSTDSLGHARSRIDLHARAGWRDATQVGFYGLGTATSEDDRTSFRMMHGYVGGDAEVRPVFPIVLGGGLAYEDFDSGDPLGDRRPVDELFGPAEAPGLGAGPVFVHGQARAAIDWRPSAGYTRTGGLYEVRYHRYADRDDTFSFDRLDGEIVQHVPLLREQFVISLRGRVQTILGDEDLVPYFMLPSLGSGSTLREFSSWRFRDRHSLLLQAEWRWIPNRYGMDMALFYDAGKVTSRRADLDLEGLKSDFGIGVRFHGPAVTPVRIELARSNERLRLVFGGSAAF